MKDVLDMYIIQFGRKNGVQITICDECNEKLFFKTLRASVYTSTRLKDKSEIRFCNAKYAKSFDSKKSEDERLEWEEYYKEEEANESSDEANFYTIKEAAEMLNITSKELKKYLVNTDYWWYNQKQNRYQPRTKYCKYNDEKQKDKYRMFYLLEVEDDVKSGITDIGIKVLKKELLSL